MKNTSSVLFLLLFLAGSCKSPSGGKESVNSGTSSASKVHESTLVNKKDMPSIGVGPVRELKLDVIDPFLAEKGKTIFEAKCSACHKIEEKYVGPALKGVTKRRTPEWIMNMMLNPVEMTEKDPIAKELLGTYLVQMTFQDLIQDDGRKILEFFRLIDKE